MKFVPLCTYVVWNLVNIKLRAYWIQNTIPTKIQSGTVDTGLNIAEDKIQCEARISKVKL